MTAPLAPMEARCERCHDTGSLSKHMDGDLDCHYCDATEKRLALRAHLAYVTGWPQNDVTAWAAYLFAQRQAAPVAQQPAEPHQPVPELRQVLRESLASGLTQTYGCSRTWSAWGVGTMSENDFYPADECDEILDELCDLAIAVLGTPQPAQQVEAVGQWKALTDVQWMNIVNHEHAYDLYSKDDAVHLAVKMTEAKCKELNTATQLEAQQAGDVARDALKVARAALNTAEYAIKGREHTGFITNAVAVIDAAIAQGRKA